MVQVGQKVICNGFEGTITRYYGANATRSVFDAARAQKPPVDHLPLISNGLKREKVAAFFLQVLEKEHASRMGAIGIGRILCGPSVPFTNDGAFGWRVPRKSYRRRLSLVAGIGVMAFGWFGLFFGDWWSPIICAARGGI